MRATSSSVSSVLRRALSMAFALAVVLWVSSLAQASEAAPTTLPTTRAAQSQTTASWSIPALWWIAPGASLVALVFALIFYKQVKAANEGSEDMKRIAAHVRDGAYAY